jgi:hypothetical protein
MLQGGGNPTIFTLIEVRFCFLDDFGFTAHIFYVFAAWDYEDSIDSPYLAREDSKHIVRLMLWAMFCALPRDRFDGLFPTALIDRNETKKKFETDLLSDVMNQDTDPEEILYFLKNLKNRREE